MLPAYVLCVLDCILYLEILRWLTHVNDVAMNDTKEIEAWKKRIQKGDEFRECQIMLCQPRNDTFYYDEVHRITSYCDIPE